MAGLEIRSFRADCFGGGKGGAGRGEPAWVYMTIEGKILVRWDDLGCTILDAT